MNRQAYCPPVRRLLAVLGAATAVGLLTGCGSAEDAAHTRSGETQAHAATAARASEPPPSPSDQVRVLKEGKKLQVAISPDSTLDIPASSAVVTLTELKQSDSLPNDAGLDPEVADPGMTFVCLEMKVKNTSSEDFDTYPLTHARWTGKDGETKNVDEVTSGNRSGLGMAEESFLNEPDPRPGEFVRATTVLMVPDGQPGYLEFADRQDFGMFKVETHASG